MSQLNTQEVAQNAEILDGESLIEESLDLIDKREIIARQDNIIDIDQSCDESASFVIDKKRGIRRGGTETKFTESSREFFIPITRCLTKPINGFMQPTHSCVSRLAKTLQKFHIDLLINITVQEGIVDVQLMNMPPTTDSDRDEAMNSDQIGNGGEGILEIKTFDLSISLCHKTIFVTLYRPIGIKLDLEDPL
ncbi:unnamed protein product [Linum trigynum]|uniref:Uncharacterized protein n=1 Tax=Linum trigynum TaxID=586398 RepID=A0AAV2FH75_9ROSI